MALASPAAAQGEAQDGVEPATRDPSPHSEARLVSTVESIRPGEAFDAAIHLTLDEGWHTYWLNGGDAGLPLQVEWDLPSGFEPSELRWPAPHLIPVPPLVSYGYEGQLAVPVRILTPTEIEPASEVRLAGAVEFLVCADVCLPASAELELVLPVRDSRPEPDPNWGAAVADVLDRIPTAGSWAVRAWTTDSTYVVEVVPRAEPPTPVDLVAPYLFVDSMNVVQHAEPQRITRSGDTLWLEIPHNRWAVGTVSRLRGVLVADAEAGTPRGWWIETDVTAPPDDAAAAIVARAADDAQLTGGARMGSVPGAEGAGAGSVPEGTPPATEPQEAASGERRADGGELGLGLALLFAFAGGLILNLMPCVFPVLSVKVLGFVDQAGGEQGEARRHGLLFAAGVLVSFWILAGALLALRASGQSLGWGFQLQSPGIVAALAVLLFALGLNLSGVFEIGLGLTRLGGVGSEKGYVDSFLTGGLTVLVATPCTAPFMGAALGFALVQPPVAGFGVFTALALGLAAPYVLLSFVPGLIERLPRPGAWMEGVRQALAFPLYATVVWLVWVFGRQAGIDATALLLLALTTLALGAWLYARGGAGRKGGMRSAALRVAALVALLAGGALVVQGTLLAEPPATDRFRTTVGGSLPGAGSGAATAGDGTTGAASASRWEEFSPARVDELRAAGRPVFIDFTAAWCLSCQVNERVALGTSAVRTAFAEADVALLEADWTNRDPVIARAIESFGRSGVPLYVLYPAGGGEPEILPAVLTPGIVTDAVRRAAG